MRQNGGNKPEPIAPPPPPPPQPIEDDSSDEDDDGRVANDGTLLASDPPKPL